MSPEAIQRNRWGEPSDVWAFGVLMWEVATMGAMPYQSHGVFMDDEQVQVGVCSGQLRLPRPPGCEDCIYRVMTKCWEQRAAARPNFRELRALLQEAIFRLSDAGAGGTTPKRVRHWPDIMHRPPAELKLLVGARVSPTCGIAASLTRVGWCIYTYTQGIFSQCLSIYVRVY